jgi:hypothetical protein
MRTSLRTALGRVNDQAMIRICWPDPDKVCLQSGCIHCQDSLYRLRVTAVAEYASQYGMDEDFAYGLGVNWSARMEFDS